MSRQAVTSPGKRAAKARAGKKKELESRPSQAVQRMERHPVPAQTDTGALGTRVDLRLSYWNQCVSSTRALYTQAADVDSLATAVRLPSNAGPAMEAAGRDDPANQVSSGAVGSAHAEPLEEGVSAPLTQEESLGTEQPRPWPLERSLPLADRGYTPPPPLGGGHRRGSAHPQAQEPPAPRAARSRHLERRPLERSVPLAKGVHWDLTPSTSAAVAASPVGRVTDGSPIRDSPSVEGRPTPSPSDWSLARHRHAPSLPSAATGSPGRESESPRGGRHTAGVPWVFSPGAVKGSEPGSRTDLPLRSATSGLPGGARVGRQVGGVPVGGPEAAGVGLGRTAGLPLRSAKSGVPGGAKGGRPPLPKTSSSNPGNRDAPGPSRSHSRTDPEPPTQTRTTRVHRSFTSINSSMAASSLSMSSIASSSTSSSSVSSTVASTTPTLMLGSLQSASAGLGPSTSGSATFSPSWATRTAIPSTTSPAWAAKGEGPSTAGPASLNLTLDSKGPSPRGSQQRLRTARTGSGGGETGSGFLRGGSCGGYSDASCGTLASYSDTSGLSLVSRSGTFSSTSGGMTSPSTVWRDGSLGPAWSTPGNSPGCTPGRPVGERQHSLTAGKPAPASLAPGRQRVLPKARLGKDDSGSQSCELGGLDFPRPEPHSQSDQPTPVHTSAGPPSMPAHKDTKRSTDIGSHLRSDTGSDGGKPRAEQILVHPLVGPPQSAGRLNVFYWAAAARAARRAPADEMGWLSLAE